MEELGTTRGRGVGPDREATPDSATWDVHEDAEIDQTLDVFRAEVKSVKR